MELVVTTSLLRVKSRAEVSYESFECFRRDNSNGWNVRGPTWRGRRVSRGRRWISWRGRIPWGRIPRGRISWRGTSCETRFRRASWFRRPSRFWSEALCRPGISARFPFVYCVRTSFPSGFQDVWIIGRDFAVLRFSFLSLCSCRTVLFTTDLLSADLYSAGPDTDDERLPQHQ